MRGIHYVRKKAKRCSINIEEKGKGMYLSCVFPLHRKFGCDSRHVAVTI